MIGKLRKEVWAGLSPTDALKRIANVGERTTVENHIKKTVPDAFVQFDAGTGTWIKPRTGGNAQEAALATRLNHTQENLSMWHELHLRGSEGLTPTQNALLGTSLADASRQVFGSDLFTGVPTNKIAEGLVTIINSQTYRDKVNDKLTAAFMKAGTFDGTALKTAYDTAVAEETAAKTAYTAAPLADKPAKRNEWEQKMRVLDKAKKEMEDPAGALEAEIKNIGKDALLDILSAQIDTGSAKYADIETQEKTEHATTATSARNDILKRVWKKRAIDKKTLVQTEVVNKGEAKKLKRAMMRGGSEAVLREVLKSGKVDQKTRDAFKRLQTESPEEYEKLKVQVAKDFMHDYLEDKGTLTMREVKKIIKKGHEADLYRIVAMAMRGKDDPASVAMNDLDLNMLREHLTKTPIDRIKPIGHFLFATPRGRMLLLAALGTGAGLWYWANFNTVNAAVGGAASWVGTKIGESYNAIKDAVTGYNTTAWNKQYSYELVPSDYKTPQYMKVTRFIPEVTHTSGAIENATNWWQNTAQPAITTNAQYAFDTTFGVDAEVGGTGGTGAGLDYQAAQAVGGIGEGMRTVGGAIGGAFNSTLTTASNIVKQFGR